ncbi:TPA: hypothetical protein OUG59_000027 [Escherichia coli]|nr:hypothetical protein [Escherichia coli]EIG2126278.1 hypothetical protein [Escherichia coli]EIK3125364.1 hypothetical protein [Escherichia coli]EJV4896850.1 hypothetical protein [Escherichia coli]EKN1675506.1 hypothetical protein [Escherichia coli]
MVQLVDFARCVSF